VSIETITTGTRIPLTELVGDWLTHLEGANRSRQTLKTYSAGVQSFLRWHLREFPAAEPQIDRKTVDLWLTALRREGKAPSSIRLWWNTLRLFTGWLADPDVAELDRDPLANMKPPKGGKPQVKRVDDDDIKALIAQCKGRSFADRRDYAIVMVLATTGMRASECVNLTVEDIDKANRRIIIQHGKGDKARVVPLAPKTADAVNAYLRARRSPMTARGALHPLAHTGTLWLGELQHPSFGYQGLARAIGQRAAAAGLEGFHLHRLRHSFASRFLAAGGTEADLMMLCGWSDPAMARLYSQDTARERALANAAGMPLDVF
jgi:integrase